MFSLLMACDHNGAIGRSNQIPWRLKDDMRQFKAYTEGKTVVMGYETALSLGKALPKRTNLVMSKNRPAPFDGVTMIRSLNELLEYHKQHGGEIVVCGGAQIYDLLFPYVKKMRITHVRTFTSGADTLWRPPGFSPLPDGHLKCPEGWSMAFPWKVQAANDDNEHAFAVCTYMRSDFEL